MDEREQLERAIKALEAQRGELGNDAVDTALVAFRTKLAALNRVAAVTQPVGSLITAAFVDREAELQALQDALQEAIADGSMKTVLVVGESGIGKTRLADEFRCRLNSSGQTLVICQGSGDWQNNLLPYALLRELIAAHFQILPADTPQAAQEKLLRGVEKWMGEESLEAAHWIAHLAGYEFAHSPYLNGRLDDPRRARQLAFQALNTCLVAIARQTPLLLIIDDLQWADEGSLDWIDSLSRCETAGPLLMICLTRPSFLEHRRDWGVHWSSYRRIGLDPLNDVQAVSLAGQLFRLAQGAARQLGMVSHSPTIPLRRIITRAEGNPYFLEELVQACVVGTGSQPPGSPAAVQITDPARLPATLEEALQARIDSLPRAERDLALRAAVVGPVFWEAAVWALMEADSEDRGSETGALRALELPASLLALQQRGLIVRREYSAFENTDEYQFSNPLIYQAAYESQVVRQRRRDHARAAAWLAAQSSERVEAYAAAIAGHYECAGDREQAAEWFGLAAHQARHSSAPEGAIYFFNRALELLPVEPGHFVQRVHLYKGLWDVQWWQAQYADALATGQALLAAAESQGDKPAQAAAWNRIAAVQNRQGEYQPALRSVQRAERLARTGNAAREVVLALFNRGVTLYRLGDSAAALEAGEQALAFNQSLHLAPAENENAEDGPAFILKDTGPLNASALHMRGSERDSARDSAHDSGATEKPDGQPEPEDRGRELNPGREATRETARILSLLAMINQRAGRFAQAESDYRQALKLQRARGDRPAMVTALNNLGTNAYHQGDYRAAFGYFQEAMQFTRELGYYDLELVCLNHMAGAQVELEEYEQAETGLQEVLRRTGSASWFMLAEVHRNLAAALVGQKRCDEALSAGLHALDLARQARSNENIGRAWRVLGRVAAALHEVEAEPPRSVMVDGRACSAHDCYAASLQVFVEMGAAGEQARTIRDWAANELKLGDRLEGQRLWKEARDLFLRLGLAREVERMDQQALSREEQE